jgi:hypothetical protein
MKDDVEIPPGLVRVWMMVACTILCGFIAFTGGYAAGHATARIETKVERVEVPYPDTCVDVMIKVDSDLANVKCTHPSQRGEFQSVAFPAELHDKRSYLVCTCPHAQLTLPEAGLQ